MTVGPHLPWRMGRPGVSPIWVVLLVCPETLRPTQHCSPTPPGTKDTLPHETTNLLRYPTIPPLWTIKSNSRSNYVDSTDYLLRRDDPRPVPRVDCSPPPVFQSGGPETLRVSKVPSRSLKFGRLCRTHFPPLPLSLVLLIRSSQIIFYFFPFV